MGRGGGGGVGVDGTRDEPLRTSAWEARGEVHRGVG